MNKIPNIKRMSDIEKLNILHLVIKEVNRSSKEFDPSFFGYEPIINLTFSGSTGELTSRLIKINGQSSFFILMENNKLVFEETYFENISPKLLKKYEGKEVIVTASPVITNASGTIDGIIFWVGLVLFVHNPHPISFLDVLPFDPDKISDDYSAQCFEFIESHIREIQESKMIELAMFLKKFLPKNIKTKSFLEEIILDTEQSAEALLEESSPIDVDELFRSAKENK